MDTEPREWKMGYVGWGNHITWSDYVKGRFYGHKPAYHPKVGDTLTCELQSGLTGRFTVTECRTMHDPTDMFMGTATFKEYVDGRNPPWRQS